MEPTTPTLWWWWCDGMGWGGGCGGTLQLLEMLWVVFAARIGGGGEEELAIGAKGDSAVEGRVPSALTCPCGSGDVRSVVAEEVAASNTIRGGSDRNTAARPSSNGRALRKHLVAPLM